MLTSLASISYLTIKDNQQISLAKQIQTNITLLEWGSGFGFGISKNGNSIAYVNNSKNVMLSTDYGNSFTSIGTTTLTRASQLVVSNDGKYIYFIYDSGHPGIDRFEKLINGSWSKRNSNTILSKNPSFIAMNSTGKYLVAIIGYADIVISTDYGVTWTTKVTNVSAIACSIDTTGKYMVCSLNRGLDMSYYYSSNYGTNWSFVISNYNTNYYGRHIAMSNDGTTFITNWIGNGGISVFTYSEDSGSTSNFSSSTIRQLFGGVTMHQFVVNADGTDVYFIKNKQLYKTSDNLQTATPLGTTIADIWAYLHASANCKYILTTDVGSVSGTRTCNLFLTTIPDITEI